jgi:hypothetical protein
MATRRPLSEGVKPADKAAEEAFVFGGKKAAEPPAAPRPGRPVQRSPITSRIRADMAVALKRATLERQLAGEYPNTLQEILEEAVEPWLRQHGYLP